MRQGMRILFDIGFAFQLQAHALQRLRQLGQFPAAHFGQWRIFALRHPVGITHQPAYRPVDPPDEYRPDQQRDPQQQRAGPQNAPFAALDHQRHGAVGFTHGEHADNAPLFYHRRGHIHHRTVFILRVAAGAAGAVLAAQLDKRHSSANNPAPARGRRNRR